MARQLYATEFVQLAGSANPAPNLPFTVWTDLVAGSNVTTQIVGPDGSSAYTATTDSQGNIAPFRGPDGYLGNLFVDTGAAYRFMLDSPTLLDYLVANVGVGSGGSSAVTSVAGRIGDVTVTKIDVGLGNVDNTTDASKPVSAPQQTALNAKANDNAVAHLAGTNTFTGPNTFTTSPAVPTPVNPTDAANRAFVLANVGTGSGVTDHGALSGLGDDDHPQYHNDARGDARYTTPAQVATTVNTAVTTASTADRNRANHSGTQLASSISDFTSAVQAVAGTGTLADNSVTAAKIVDGAVGLAELSGPVLNTFPRTDAAQTLSTGQKAQARSNIGVGFTIAGARLATDPLLSDAQALALYGEGAFFTVDPA